MLGFGALGEFALGEFDDVEGIAAAGSVTATVLSNGVSAGGGLRRTRPSRSARRLARAAELFGDFGGGGGGGGGGNSSVVAEERGGAQRDDSLATDELKSPDIAAPKAATSSPLSGAAAFGLSDVPPLELNPEAAALALAQKIKDALALQLAEELAHDALAQLAHEQIREQQRKRRNEVLAILLTA